MEIATAIKTAAVAVQNRDKMAKAVGITVVVAVSPLIFLSICYLSIMSAFAPDGVLKSADQFAGENSAIYRSVRGVTESFYQQLEAKMADRREDVIRYNTYIYDIVDENGMTQTVEDIPVVTRRLTYIPVSVLIAYLLMIDGVNTESAVIDGQSVWNFLQDITHISETYQGNGAFLIENTALSQDEIARKYFIDDSSRQRFLVLCNAYSDYFDTAPVKVTTDDGVESFEGIFSPNISGVPLYLQYDPAWGSLPYGNGNIKRNGCCPTCLAMVFSYLNGQEILPNHITSWSGNRYYINGQGTSWNIFEPASRQWGVQCTNIGKNVKQMKEALSEGKLIVASMGPGTFTKGGHFIVLTGITEDGKIKVNDPNDNGLKQHANKSFDMGMILRECKNMWVFERYK